MADNKELLKDDYISKKSVIRLIIFSILSIISYLICTISLFSQNSFIIPTISFIALFILIYFVALDCYRIKFSWVLLILLIIFIAETVSFIVFLDFSWYLIIELILFNITIWTLLYFLMRQLKYRTSFSVFSYFTEGWFIVTTLLTIFFCVFMMWKYTEIPFTCDDIWSFSEKVMETTVNPIKKWWNNFIWRFSKSDSDQEILKPKFNTISNPLSSSTDLASANNLENFFINARNYIQTQTKDIKWDVSKVTCEYYMWILQKVQKNGKIQLAAIILWYFLLVWIFKILLRIVTIVWFLLFVLLRVFWVYSYEKRLVEKEVIV